MKLSLREVMGKAVDAYPSTPRKSWVLNWPGQVVIAGSTIYWTAEVTKVGEIIPCVQVSAGGSLSALSLSALGPSLSLSTKKKKKMSPSLDSLQQWFNHNFYHHS